MVWVEYPVPVVFSANHLFSRFNCSNLVGKGREGKEGKGRKGRPLNVWDCGWFNIGIHSSVSSQLIVVKYSSVDKMYALLLTYPTSSLLVSFPFFSPLLLCTSPTHSSSPSSFYFNWLLYLLFKDWWDLCNLILFFFTSFHPAPVDGCWLCSVVSMIQMRFRLPCILYWNWLMRFVIQCTYIK